MRSSDSLNRKICCHLNPAVNDHHIDTFDGNALFRLQLQVSVLHTAIKNRTAGISWAINAYSLLLP